MSNLNEILYGYNDYGFPANPARQLRKGFGYDPENYISTAKLAPAPYTTQALVEARIGGRDRLIEACIDSPTSPRSLEPSNPPNNSTYLTFQNVLQNVTTEINGYLSSIYPVPLVQTGTVAIIQIDSVDSSGTVQAGGISVIESGNYLTAPATTNSPAYLRYIDPLENAKWYGENYSQCQQGSGLSLTVAYSDADYSDESGQVLQAKTVSGTPTVTNGGAGYQENDLVVLVGGTSFVPAKIRQAMLDLVCYSLYQRGIAPQEINQFSGEAKTWRDFLKGIGNGENQLDGTYKRFYSAGFAWNQRSVLVGANSL
ncbi:MAG: hypothetical protein KGL39_47500 [Patescibacteria group bacterium]|nr:hypothetical protein [Patescibacteria group bacterium]